MTTREKVEKLLDQLSEAELEAEYKWLREAVAGEGELAALLDEEADELLGELDKQEAWFEAESKLTPAEVKARDGRRAEANARELIREEPW